MQSLRIRRTAPFALVLFLSLPSIASAQQTPEPSPQAPRSQGNGSSSAPPVDGEQRLLSPLDPGGTPVTPTTTLTVGQVVQVNWNGMWYQARVVRLLGRRVRLHYFGYPASQDDNRPRGDLRIGGTIVPEAPSHGRADPGGAPVTPATPIDEGQVVQIDWNRTWYLGRVIGVNPDGTVRVHYNGYPVSQDENVARNRLRIGGTIREDAAAEGRPGGAH